MPILAASVAFAHGPILPISSPYASLHFPLHPLFRLPPVFRPAPYPPPHYFVAIFAILRRYHFLSPRPQKLQKGICRMFLEGI